MKKIFSLLILPLLLWGSIFCSGKKSGQNPQVILQTNMGNITLELYPKIAPKTVTNFVELAEGKKAFIDPNSGKEIKRPYYDGLVFHRVIDGFMIQGGDILGNGSGGPGYKFEDEISAKVLGLDKIPASSSQMYMREVQQYVFKKLNIQSQEELDKRIEEVKQELAKAMQEGVSVAEVLQASGYHFQNDLQSMPVKKYTIAMANSGPNTNGSQFFINLNDNEYLNGKHTVFGKVIDGFEIVDKIGKVETAANDRPVKDVVIEKVVVK